MRLPEIQLDDRRFQDLVSEARLRIHRVCPEWTEHNVSDPGITLIELFAWMTEMTIYRLNRVPDKLHVGLLELLGIQLDPPSAASTEIRFRLVEPARAAVRIAAGETEVGTPRSTEEESVVFQVDDDFTIPPARPAAFVLQRGGQVRDVGVAAGQARPQGADQLAFGDPPAPGDALHLGFEEPIGRLLLAVEVDASQARGTGVDPEDAPLLWEVSQGGGRWKEAQVLDDTTGAFNYGSGTVELQAPAQSGVHPLGGHRLHWLRCRVTETTRSGARATYAHAPEVYTITAAPIGALLPASHASRVEREELGTSDGTPGQVFALRHAPVLRPGVGEVLEVREPGRSDWASWEMVEDFVGSTAADPHYVLDEVSGELELGPAVRGSDGVWAQHGAVPAKGAALRMARYRHGGGREGNVAAGTLVALKSPIAGVDTVVNPEPAQGGVDAEGLDHARQRAAMEIRSRYRAVTAQDFEFLAGEASPRVARAVCLPPQDGGPVSLHIVPHVHPPDRALSHEELLPSPELLAEVAAYIDERRLVGTVVELLPCRFRALSVVVNIQAARLADPGRVEADVTHALHTYLNPLVGGDPRGPGEGWPFGRSMNQGELYGVVHAVDGVELVKVLRVYETDLATGEQAPKPEAGQIVIGPDELIASGAHIVKASHRA